MRGRGRTVLYLMLALTLGATAWVSRMEEDGVVEAVAPAAERASRAAPERDTSQAGQEPQKPVLAKLERAPIVVGDVNPFQPKSWYVAPPAPPPPPPAAPTAPPLPFTFQGKLEEAPGQWVVYLVNGGQFYAVRKGEKLDNDYRFDGIENGNLVIQYLPLAVKQTIPVGTEE